VAAAAAPAAAGGSTSAAEEEHVAADACSPAISSPSHQRSFVADIQHEFLRPRAPPSGYATAEGSYRGGVNGKSEWALVNGKSEWANRSSMLNEGPKH